MVQSPNLNILINRLWSYNFIAKVIALGVNTLCAYVWVTGVRDSSLPTNNHHQLTLLYHTIPPFNIILSGLVIMYLVGEVPTRVTQEVFDVIGFTLYLIFGTIGIKNTIDNDYPPMMFVMSLMCYGVASALVFDFVKVENYFKPHREGIDVTF